MVIGNESKVLTMDSFIRNMPHSVYMKLAAMLDPGNLWEKFAVKIPKILEMTGNSDAEPRYTYQHIELIAHQSHQNQRGSSTRRVLQDWGTQNARIHHLITVLLSAELYAAADYLHNDLLHLGVAPRSGDQHSDCNGDSNSKQPPGSSENIVDQSGASNATRTLGDRDAREDHNTFLGSDMCSTCSDIMSWISGQVSEEAQSGNPMSLPRPDSTESKKPELTTLIDMSNTEIQNILYSMLCHITNSFNEQPLEKGGNLIGSGGFGMVYLGQFHNGFKVAVKCLKQNGQMKMEDLVKQIETEVKTLSKYRHENVVHLLGYSVDGVSPCLVYQYLSNGSLEDRLACLNGTSPLSASLRLNILKGTASGIAYLNSQKHVHRDIKSANILLDSQFTAKVGDFATVCAAPTGASQTVKQVSVVIGTPVYLAPEAIHFDVSTKLDSYSFGVVILEVLTGLPAQDNMREEKDITTHILENCEKPSQIHDFVDKSAGTWRPDIVDTLFDVACRCLQHRKKVRPNVIDIKPELDALGN